MPMTNVSVLFGMVDATVSNEAAAGWAAFGGFADWLTIFVVIFTISVVGKTLYDQYVISEGVFAKGDTATKIIAAYQTEYLRGMQKEPSNVDKIIDVVKKYW